MGECIVGSERGVGVEVLQEGWEGHTAPISLEFALHVLENAIDVFQGQGEVQRALWLGVLCPEVPLEYEAECLGLLLLVFGNDPVSLREARDLEDLGFT